MDKAELRKILKPLIKTCIKEVLMEYGLRNVISETLEKEVTKNYTGLGKLEPQQLAASNRGNGPAISPQTPEDDSGAEARKRIQENHKRMMQEIGNSGYVANGFNPFSGTSALGSNQAPESDQRPVTENRNMPPAMNNIDPSDPGVDIRGIMSIAAGKWKTHLGIKGK